MKHDGIIVMGMHGISKGEHMEFNAPDDFHIQGFITNFGDLYSINKNNCKFPMLPSKFYTKKELKIYINILRRKEKLERLNNI